MGKEYTFAEQKRVGDIAENTIERYLLESERTELMKVDKLSEQMKGIDFQLSVSGGDWTPIEVKIDNICHKNGRYFLEIELVKSNGKHSKDGWVLTTTSKYLFLMVGKTNCMKVVDPEFLRDNLYRWRRAYGVRECYNKGGYSSIGICVPFAHIKGLCVDLDNDCEEVLDYIESN